jgi:hypothetical protein
MAGYVETIHPGLYNLVDGPDRDIVRKGWCSLTHECGPLDSR